MANRRAGCSGICAPATKARSHADHGAATARAATMRRRWSPPASPRSMRACAAVCRAASCRKSSGPGRRAARRCCADARGTATRRGEIAAVVDTFDRLDVASAAAAGIDLDRLLWIRGDAIAGNGSDRAASEPIARALKALNLVLQAGGFACVAIDLADVPRAVAHADPVHDLAARAAHRRRKRHRLRARRAAAAGAQRGRPHAVAHRRARAWTGDTDRSRHVCGADVTARIVSPRRRVDGEVACQAVVATTVTDHRPRRHERHGAFIETR